MNCNKCGTPATLTGSDGGTDFGDSFTEYYECPTCGARGEVRGTVGESSDVWEQSGAIFVNY
jgi:DNA-directed RNA polymerase subunit RPC12/RpoP